MGRKGSGASRAEVRVLYADTDRMGVVYYGNYFRFFEAGRAHWMRERGKPYSEVEREYDIRMPVAEATCRYRAPAVYDDLIVVETRLTELGHASCTFSYRVLRGDELLAEGATLHAAVDARGRIVRFPKEVRALLEE
jgi:acyl-CoA thioester hydrolase